MSIFNRIVDISITTGYLICTIKHIFLALEQEFAAANYWATLSVFFIILTIYHKYNRESKF